MPAAKKRTRSRTKTKSRSQSRTRKRSPPPSSNICHICKVWGDEADKGCEECSHAYHDKCIDEDFRGGHFETCDDLGQQCDSEAEATQFLFGKQTNVRLKDKGKQKQQCVASKRASRRSKNTKNKSNRQSIGRSRAFTQREYESCTFNHVEYKTGDDVVIDMVKEDGYWGVARITKIFKKDDETIPKFELIWFWRATEVHHMELRKDCRSGERGTDSDILEHELHLDQDVWAQPCNWDVILGKALVLPSSEDYLQRVHSLDNDYYDAFWCTHSYCDGKKSLLPPGVIASHAVTGITPVPPKKQRSRKRNRADQVKQLLHDAGKALMLSSVPTSLPCREKEHDQIENYMKQQISCHGQGSGLYMSGMPGTGKTATVRQIAKELQKLTVPKKKKSKAKLPEFTFHEINAMKLPTPKHLYTELCKKLMDTHVSPNTAVKKLEKYFSSKDEKRKICVLLVDELDYLLTKQQKVIYNIFDWPTKSTAKLVVIGIANTMDLPERLLPRVASRMGTTRVVFKAYKKEQLIQIIEHRLRETKIFSNDAIRYCATSVAGVSGDCRAALQICRRAVEMVQNEIKEKGISCVMTGSHTAQNENHNSHQNQKKRAKVNKKKKGNGRDEEEANVEEEVLVTFDYVKRAKESFDKSNDFQVICNLAIHEQLFLTAIVMCNARSAEFAETTEKYRRKFDNFVQTKLGGRKMKNVHFRNMLDRLKEIGIICITFDKKEWIEWIRFNIEIEEAKHALKENDVCAKIISALQV